MAETVGSKVRKARERAGLSQRRLAKAAKTSALTVFRVEQGWTIPNMRTLIKLAKALKVPVKRLLS